MALNDIAESMGLSVSIKVRARCADLHLGGLSTRNDAALRSLPLTCLRLP